MTVYGAGLRLNEACHLKIKDLNSARGQIRVEQGKGRKDRYTLFSPALQEQLRIYWKAFRPLHWLFPSSKQPNEPMCDGTGQKTFGRPLPAPASAPRGIHSLSNGVDMRMFFDATGLERQAEGSLQLEWLIGSVAVLAPAAVTLGRKEQRGSRWVFHC
jgi:hypothetical protein